jgi:hypothetical protein
MRELKMRRKEGPPTISMDSEVPNAVHAWTGHKLLFGSAHRFPRGPGSEDNFLYKSSVRAL